MRQINIDHRARHPTTGASEPMTSWPMTLILSTIYLRKESYHIALATALSPLVQRRLHRIRLPGQADAEPANVRFKRFGELPGLSRAFG